MRNKRTNEKSINIRIGQEIVEDAGSQKFIPLNLTYSIMSSNFEQKKRIKKNVL